jgi:hypothetical protein
MGCSLELWNFAPAAAQFAAQRAPVRAKLLHHGPEVRPVVHFRRAAWTGLYEITRISINQQFDGNCSSMGILLKVPECTGDPVLTP